jgi:hypothetical protein
VGGALTEPAEGLIDDCLGVIQVDFPATSVGELGELLAIHDGVGAGLIGRATLDGDVVREVEWPGPKRDRQDRRGQRGCCYPRRLLHANPHRGPSSDTSTAS